MSTAEYIEPSNVAGCVLCPTCRHPVKLADWWLHGCKDVGPHFGAPDTTVPRARKAPATRTKTWAGDVPASCNECGAAIRNGFADAPLSNGRTWGHLCGLCWEFTVCPPVGQYYERRGKRWVRTQSRG